MLHVTTRDVCGGGELGQFSSSLTESYVMGDSSSVKK